MAPTSDHIHPAVAPRHYRKEPLEQLSFSGSAANANYALRTLRRLLHKAEDWKLTRRPPKIKLLLEQERSLRLDDEAERKILASAEQCNRRPRILELFRDIVMLARDTGMRNEKELYRIRIENIGWDRHIVFVPGIKTAMKYQHPELDIVRAALNDTAPGPQVSA